MHSLKIHDVFFEYPLENGCGVAREKSQPTLNARTSVFPHKLCLLEYLLCSSHGRFELSFLENAAKMLALRIYPWL